MLTGIIGRKLGTAQIYNKEGEVIPVTVIKAGPCTVTQVKTKDKDGYEAVQLGFEETEKLNSPLKGHLKNLGNFRYLHELKALDIENVSRGMKVAVDIFKEGEKVSVTGTSKGKGFAGGVKRYHFKGGPKTHGQSDRHRAPGSIGSTTTPGRVWKGLRMAGHMGNDTVTQRNLVVIKVEPSQNLLLVKGAIPGYKNSLVIIKKSKTKQSK